ncbi:hypothetical protein ACT80S_09335 [Ramlibacter sp. MAHUQ-53]|uniref:hypothetical protein n=1 Tax=unclassified Ramlibacter TaxID=2617605 RepID=UPI00363D30F0
MYSVRVKPTPSLKLEDLAALTHHDGKAVPADKELRVSGSWKVKEKPGDSSFSGRDAHRTSAVTGLKTLWTDALKQRNCSQIEGEIWRAASGVKPAVVTVGTLRRLVSVTSLIDVLHKETQLPRYRAAELVAHAITIVPLDDLTTQHARLRLAADAMFDAGEMLTAPEAYASAADRGAQSQDNKRDSVRIQTINVPKPSQTPQRPTSQSVAQPEPVALTPSVAKPLAPSPAGRPSPVSAPTSQGTPPREFTDEHRAAAHVKAVLAGADTRSVSNFITPGEKPLLIKGLLAALEALNQPETDAAIRERKVLAIARLFDAWQLQGVRPRVASFTDEDRSALPAPVRAQLLKAVELASLKLPPAR